MENDLKLLDCTLRDGGYVNDWKWGLQSAREIIRLLVRAGIDIVEVGFLRNVEAYNPDITVCNYIEELNKLLPESIGQTMFSAMAMRSNYDVKKLSEYRGKGIEMIRVTAHDYDIEEGMEFAETVKAKGYKLSINPINIMGYSDEKILWMIDRVNDIHPYQFSIVDTFGSMKKRDFDRIVSIVDYNLDKDIRMALHLHENMSLSFFLAQNYADMHLNRPITIDGSLMGMGRIPGNLPIELIADYLNEYLGKLYDIDYLMDAIQDFIAPMKGNSLWGYTPAYFLSARFNLHRNYAEYYLKKGDLTHKDINHILSRIEDDKKTAFDEAYANSLYEEYQDNKTDDLRDRGELLKCFEGREILIMAPGASIKEFEGRIKSYIDENKLLVVSINFIPDNIVPDYAFFSNNKRYDKIDGFPCKTIVTSNIKDSEASYTIDYNSLSGAFDMGCNSFIMLLKLLKGMKPKRIVCAGADGYAKDRENYYRPNFQIGEKRGNRFNLAVAEAIRKIDAKVTFLTPSAYDKHSL